MMEIIGIGVDLTEVFRIRDLLREREKRSLSRVFTKDEIEYCERKVDPAIHFAGKFAAKEAIIKSLIAGYDTGLLLNEIEILNEGNGAPTVTLYGKAREIFNEMGGTSMKVSITHNEENAMAFAVCQGPSG